MSKLERLIIERLIELLTKLEIKELSESELEIRGEYEHLIRLYEVLRQLGIETYLEKEYDGYGFKTYYLRVILHS